MGRVQQTRELAERRALSIAAQSEIDPVTASVDQLRESLNAASQELALMHQEMGGFLNTFLDQLEAGENARAERLRQTIDPVLETTQAAINQAVTVISRHSTHLQALQEEMTDLRLEMISLRSNATAQALSRQMATLSQEMAALPEAVAAHLVQAMRTLSAPRHGTPVSNAGMPSPAATEIMDKARAYDLLAQKYQNHTPSIKVIEDLLKMAAEERIRRPIR